MSLEKSQLDSFFKPGAPKNPDKKEKKEPKPEEFLDSPEFKQQARDLAQEAEQAFQSNDFATALDKLKQLEQLARPEGSTLEFREAQEIFGEDFLGPEALAKTFGIELGDMQKDVLEIQFSRAELEQAKQLGMMLVLRVPTDKDNKPLTINRMREMFSGEDTLGDPAKKKSKIFYRKKGEGWYENEEFATKATPSLGWGLAAKAVLPESLGKNWDQQEEVLKEWAKANKIDPATVRRRTPVEVAYDTLLYYGANQESLLGDKWDWTDVRSSDGNLVDVGYFDSDGLYVRYDSRDYTDSSLGVCPSR